MTRIAGDVVARSRDGVSTRDLSICLFAGGSVVLESGHRLEAEAAWRDLASLAERSADATVAIRALEVPAFLGFLDGRLEEALSLQDSAAARAREQGLAEGPLGGFFSVIVRLRLLLYLGLPVDLNFNNPGRVGLAFRALTLAFQGHVDEAVATRRNFAGIESSEDETGSLILLSLLEMSVLAGDKDTAAGLTSRLAPYAAALNTNAATSFGRPLGDAAKLLGLPDEARGFYGQAIEVCEKVRFRPELALTRLGLAELLLDHYPDEHDAAIEHLDFAIAEFQDMKMQPALERALGRRGLLKA